MGCAMSFPEEDFADSFSNDFDEDAIIIRPKSYLETSNEDSSPEEFGEERESQYSQTF